MDNPFSRLQEWYLSLCDGYWEHEFGIDIASTDNPGWSVKFDLAGIGRAAEEFSEKIYRSDEDWIFVKISAGKMLIGCGPLNLSEAIERLIRIVDVVDK